MSWFVSSLLGQSLYHLKWVHRLYSQFVMVVLNCAVAMTFFGALYHLMCIKQSYTNALNVWKIIWKRFADITASAQSHGHWSSLPPPPPHHLTLIRVSIFVLHTRCPVESCPFPSAAWQIMAVLFSGEICLKYIRWIIHPLLQDCTEKQLQDKQFPES